MSNWGNEPMITKRKPIISIIENDDRLKAIREYVEIMESEPADALIPVKNVYHDLKRMLGDES